MKAVLVDLFEPLVVVLYAVVVGGLTLAGLAIEYVGLTGGGVGATQLWVVFMGGVVLAFAVLIAHDKLWPALASRNA